MRKLQFVSFSIMIFAGFLATALAQKSNGVGDHVIVSSYDRQVISRPGYDYETAVFYDAGKYRMYWCGGNTGTGVIDHIYYSTSTNGLNWTTPIDVLAPEPLALICDPSIVRVGSTYYMYLTGTLESNGTNNDVYLATSTDFVNWTKYPNDTNPQPVISRQSPQVGSFGAGMPSVLYLNGQFVMYFLDQTSPGGLYRATSSNGVNFSSPTFLLQVNDVEVKYSTTQDVFIMTRHGQFQGGPQRAFLHVSYDGFNFTPVDNSKFVIGNPANPNQFGSGIVSDRFGRITDAAWVYYGVGSPNDVDSWQIHRSTMWFFPKPEDGVYRYFGPSTKAKDHFYTFDPNSPAVYNFEAVEWISLEASDPGATPLFRLYHPTVQDHLYTASQSEKTLPSRAVIKMKAPKDTSLSFK